MHLFSWMMYWTNETLCIHKTVIYFVRLYCQSFFCEMIREACESGRLFSVHVSNVLERCFFFFHNKVITANVSVCFSS